MREPHDAASRLDWQKTAPFELGGGDDACLLLHGFTGSPWDLRPLGEALAARGYYVRAIRLPGHGTTPEAMEHVCQQDWQQAAEEALLSLDNFRQVFVAGLSMGALLGVMLAARHPDRVHGLALMAPAMRFAKRSHGLLRLLRHLPLPVLEVAQPWVMKTATDIEDPRERAEAPVLSAFPSARLRDLWGVQERAREAMARVHAPALVAAAEKDHVVSVDGARELAKGLVSSPLVRFVAVGQGFHIMPRDFGRELLLREVGDFFDGLAGKRGQATFPPDGNGRPSEK